MSLDARCSLIARAVSADGVLPRAGERTIPDEAPPSQSDVRATPGPKLEAQGVTLGYDLMTVRRHLPTLDLVDRSRRVKRRAGVLGRAGERTIPDEAPPSQSDVRATPRAERS